MAFILVAAFPALAVPLVIYSGLTLLVVGLIAGFAGKRWRARRLARARQAVAEVAEELLPGPGGAATEGDATSADPAPSMPAAWPTGRHARRKRNPAAPARTADADDTGDAALPGATPGPRARPTAA
ncbi:hypothetical protein [Pseudonocardia sp. HH130630-07]|uniref:hypothetical protein n=1 Tax=Pseudonocardia sp. HH130630-07 TaxID=1690815 RepID=UPI0008151117|nr:hypothetical protein [Pseudonocardia sp. HH130630-07]ANY05348.1 hypothetical protein AFB00_02385 [Pseudonocardia sp. HH130630-07]